MYQEDRKTIDESYATAISSSDLRCETREDAPRSDSDVLIASGWSRSRIGGALLRLHTEFDRAEKPRLMGAQDFQRQAEGDCPRGCQKSIKARAQEIADTHNRQQAKLLAGKLKTLPEARQQLVIQLTAWKVERPDDMASAVLGWWLHKTCSSCHGRKFDVIAGTARLSNKVCKVCHGTGEARVPHGEAGRRLVNFMDICVDQARHSIRNHLYR